MADEEIADLRKTLIKALDGAPDKRLFGAVLGNRLRAEKARTIKDYGFPNLSDFVKRYMASEVSQTVGVSDTIFQLNESATSTPAAGPTAPLLVSGLPNIDLLRVWKSPRSSYAIAVRRSDGTARAVSVQSHSNDDEVVLTPPSSDAHEAIARSFVEQLPAQHQEEFRSRIDERNPFWWREWETLFNARFPEERSKWLKFRETHLLDQLDTALKAEGMSEDAVLTARDTVRRSRMTKRSVASGAPAPGRIPGADGSAFRQAVLATVEQLSDEELRRIWLPAGVLYELLRTQR